MRVVKSLAPGHNSHVVSRPAPWYCPSPSVSLPSDMASFPSILESLAFLGLLAVRCTEPGDGSVFSPLDAGFVRTKPESPRGWNKGKAPLPSPTLLFLSLCSCLVVTVAPLQPSVLPCHWARDPELMAWCCFQVALPGEVLATLLPACPLLGWITWPTMQGSSTRTTSQAW